MDHVLRSKGLKGAMCMGLLVWWMSVADWKLSVLSVHKGLTPLVPGICNRWYSVRPRLVCSARGEGRASKGDFEATQGVRETLLKSTVEATSLGLKTKSGLRPNSKEYRGFIYKRVPVLKIDPRI